MDFKKCPRCNCHRTFPDEYKNNKGRIIKTCLKCRIFGAKYRLKSKTNSINLP